MYYLLLYLNLMQKGTERERERDLECPTSTIPKRNHTRVYACVCYAIVFTKWIPHDYYTILLTRIKSVKMIFRWIHKSLITQNFLAIRSHL